jgi:hypothetical protein
MKAIDLVGRTFHFLTVLECTGTRRFSGGGTQRTWRVRCVCGKEYEVTGAQLKGNSKSCGCKKNELLSRANIKHGHARVGAKSLIYGRWWTMLQRCQNPNDGGYKNYGARGIKVCERWQKFENFYADVGDPPPGRELDRIENGGNYEPGNWRWVSHQKNSSNRRNNKKHSFEGESLVASEIARLIGVHPATVLRRLKSGVPCNRIALSTDRRYTDAGRKS